MRVSKEHRPDRSETSARILAIAFDRFMSQGVARTTMDEIAHAAGLSKKTLYQLFPSKEMMLRTLTRKVLEEFHGQIRAVIDSDRPTSERLNGIMSLLAGRIGLLGSPLMIDIQRFHPEIWKEFLAFRRERIGTEVASLIRSGMEEGVIRNDLSPEVVLGAFTGAVENLLHPSALQHSGRSGPETLLEVLSLFLEGMLTMPGREAAGSSQPAGGFTADHH
jgi:TetR/AcrR family transcriptional regulator, cholesterol catabolism regulator